ncbi:MAG: SDR family oxidoreductase, partial [Sphingobacteriales bacterium]|nr:SDR family oxidoreductase [Sphingobacteriales bacterium]
MEKILITGVNGLLGQELAIQLLKKGFFVIGISRGLCRVNLARENFTYYPVDITEDIELNNVMFEERPDVVIHAAAMTQVDECELNQEKCYEVNQKGTLHTLKSAELCSSFIIHVSTDFVFDGEEGMYNEEDECRPVNWYGQCKKETESVIAVAEIPWAIVRTCLVYGKKTEGGRDNLVTWVDRKLAAGEKIKVVDDQVRTPTYAGDLASGIVQILEK